MYELQKNKLVFGDQKEESVPTFVKNKNPGILSSTKPKVNPIGFNITGKKPAADNKTELDKEKEKPRIFSFSIKDNSNKETTVIDRKSVNQLKTNVNKPINNSKITENLLSFDDNQQTLISNNSNVVNYCFKNSLLTIFSVMQQEIT